MSESDLLLVDAEPHIIELVKLGLADAPFSLHSVASGEEALDAAQADPPRLVIMEIQLPGMDGYELCRRLKSQPATSHTSVLFLTVKELEADREKGYQSGADGYLSKPVSPLRLRAEIDYLLGAQKSG